MDLTEIVQEFADDVCDRDFSAETPAAPARDPLEFAEAEGSWPGAILQPTNGGRANAGTPVLASDFKFLSDWIEEHRVSDNVLQSNGEATAVTAFSDATRNRPDLHARTLLCNDIGSALDKAFVPDRTQRVLARQQLKDFAHSPQIERLNIYDVVLPEGTTRLACVTVPSGIYKFEIDVLVRDVDSERGLASERPDAQHPIDMSGELLPRLIFKQDDQIVDAETSKAWIGSPCYTIRLPTTSRLSIYILSPRRTRIFMSYPRLSGANGVVVPKLNDEIPFHRLTAWRFTPTASVGRVKMSAAVNIAREHIEVGFVHYRIHDQDAGSKLVARRRVITFDRRAGETRASIRINLIGPCRHLICDVVMS